MDARIETSAQTSGHARSKADPHDAHQRDVNARATSLTSLRRIRCFVDSDEIPLIPRVDGIQYVADAEDEFDVFIAPEAESSAFADFIARCGNPAAPMIAFADRPHPRADIVVNEATGPSFTAAISSLQPLLKRTAALPRLPRGLDRNGLLALALMYTRDCCLEAAWQPNLPSLVEYPLLHGIDNSRSLLEEMAEAGLLRRRFYQRVHQCSHCTSSRLHARECCPSCHSSHLAENPLIHHYACAFQGPQPLFETSDGYLCPKCRKQLRHYGVDYDKPGAVINCVTCGETLAEPEVGFTCLDCNTYTSGDHIAHFDWYHYDLLPDGVAALRSGELPHSNSPDEHFNAYSLRNFRFVAGRLITVARQHNRPLALCWIHIDGDALVAKVGRRGFREVTSFLRDLIAENLRESDVLSCLPDGSFLCCLPETEHAVARAACDKLRSLMSGNLSIPISTSAEIITRDQAAIFLRELDNVR